MVRRIKLLGTLAIDEDGRPSRLMSSTRGIALVAYLIYTNDIQSREQLADLLWEASSTRQSLTRLRQLLARIRPWLPEMQITRQTVTFHPAGDGFVDLLALREGLAAGEVSRLDEALRLYTGDFLAAFYLEDAPYFNEWLVVVREQLRLRVLTAYQRLCRLYAGAEEWGKGVDAARRWVALEPLDEEAHRWLMQTLAHNGQRAAALQAYEACCQILADELGVEPEAATSELARQLAAWAEEATAVVSLPPNLTPLDPLTSGTLSEPGPLPANTILPYQRNPDFTGREADLLRVAALLGKVAADGRCPVVAITGIGGLGKTQMAVEFCYRYGRYFPGGTFWLSFADANHVAEEVAAVGGERGLGLYQDAEQLTLSERTGRVQRAWQDPIPRLLVFDNCEEEDLLAAWLPVTGGCRVLLTSQRGQWSPELGVSQSPLTVLSPADGALLLQKLDSPLDQSAAVAIAEEVAGLPLALHLAGGFLRRYRQITPEQYLEQLRNQGALQHPSLRGRGVAHSPTGHQLHVARTFAVNFARLDLSDEGDQLARQLLAHAACFAPGEPIRRQLLISTIMAPESDPLRLLLAEDGLVRLIELGLLINDGAETVTLHRLLADFTRDVLADEMAGAETAVEQTILRQLQTQHRQTTSLFVLPLASVHLRYLVDKALKRADILAADLTLQYSHHLRYIADFATSESYLRRGVPIYETLYGEEHPETARYLNGLATLHLRRGEYWEARSVFQRVLAVLEGIADLYTSNVLNNLGYLLILQGDYEAARPRLERALQIGQARPNHPRMAVYWNNLGTAWLALGDYDTAGSCLHTSLAIRQKTLGTDHPYTAVSLQNVGCLHLRLRVYDQAQHYLEKALTVREQALGENHPHTARSLQAMGQFYLATGDLEAAQAYLQRALAVQETVLTMDHPELGLTCKDLGDLHWARGETGQATRYYERAVVILQKSVVPTHPVLQQARQKLEAE